MLKYDFVKAAKNSMNDTVCVWVHGSGCNKKLLRPLAQLIECDSILIDLPGHGESTVIF